MKRSTDARVCVIGAGPSGITAGKNLLQVGVKNFVIYEKGDAIGGNWIYSPLPSHSSVFETTHIISSKTMSEYYDYAMPAHYPDYPSHRELLAYFQDYARHFGVDKYVQFNTEVVKAEKQPDETWRITLDGGQVETFDYLMVANGHHSTPRMPSYPGQETFPGPFIHSHDYKTAAPFQDQRVLVIGGGNSACDIAVETSRVASFAGISMRRGYYIVPKFTMGKPSDVLADWIAWLPDWIRVPALRLSLIFTVGDYADYGLERPKHGLLQAHLVPNNELLYLIRHGRIHPRRDIQRVEGRTVRFVDGRSEDYDAVIAATGFLITFPFFDPAFINYSQGHVPLYLRVIHPDHPSLFFIGLCQPLGALWPLSDRHAKLAANFIVGSYNPPADIRARIDRDVQHIRSHFINTPRHTIEVEYHKHAWALEREIPPDAPAWPGTTRPRRLRLIESGRPSKALWAALALGGALASWPLIRRVLR